MEKLEFTFMPQTGAHYNLVVAGDPIEGRHIALMQVYVRHVLALFAELSNGEVSADIKSEVDKFVEELARRQREMGKNDSN